MASDLPIEMRRSPQQGRSERRLADFLRVAAELFAETGYAAATMTAIAERSGTSIGGLYHYFPDKESIARALALQYSADLEVEVGAFVEETRGLDVQEMAQRFLDLFIQFFEARPAYLSLSAAGMKFSRGPAERRPLRMLLCGAFRERNPSLSEEQALRVANVSVELVKAMRTLYLDSPAVQGPLVADEFKRLLAPYWASTLGC